MTKVHIDSLVCEVTRPTLLHRAAGMLRYRLRGPWTYKKRGSGPQRLTEEHRPALMEIYERLLELKNEHLASSS